jgi:hypothetical protein
MAIVYITTNTVNGKKYLGKCVHNKSWYLGSGVAIKAAIKKYGKENFIKEILYEVQTIDEAAVLELKLSLEYNVVNDPMWYNLKYGGAGGSIPGRILSESSRKKISMSKAGSSSWNKGLSGTDAVKHKESTKHKISASNKGKGSSPGNLHPCAKRVIFTDKFGNEHDIVGIRKFCRDNNIKYSQVMTILRGCRGKIIDKPTTCGWTVRYAEQ